MNPSLRPALYDDVNGWVYIDLTDDDLALVYQAAQARFEENRKAANPDGAFRPGLSAKIDIEGLLGEVAFSLLGGVMPSQADLVLPFRDWVRERGPNGGNLTDFRGAEIRATTWERGGLFVHKDSSRDGEKKLDTIFVLAVVKNLAPIAAVDAKPNYSRRVAFKGWAYGREAVDIRHDVVSPEYFVEQSSLHSMGKLAGTLFLLPKTLSDMKAERLRQQQSVGEALLAAWERSHEEGDSVSQAAE